MSPSPSISRDSHSSRVTLCHLSSRLRFLPPPNRFSNALKKRGCFLLYPLSSADGNVGVNADSGVFPLSSANETVRMISLADSGVLRKRRRVADFPQCPCITSWRLMPRSWSRRVSHIVVMRTTLCSHRGPRIALTEGMSYANSVVIRFSLIRRTSTIADKRTLS